MISRSKILYQQPGILLDQMLDTETIVQRFLDTKLQVHPEVVRYLAEKGDNDLLDRVVSSVPVDTIVVLAQHVPGMGLSKDGTRFLTDPEVEIINGSEGSSGRCSRCGRLPPLFQAPV